MKEYMYKIIIILKYYIMAHKITTVFENNY